MCGQAVHDSATPSATKREKTRGKQVYKKKSLVTTVNNRVSQQTTSVLRIYDEISEAKMVVNTL